MISGNSITKNIQQVTTCSIIGGTGYTGQELVRILSNHPQVKINYITSRSHEGTPFNQLFPESNVTIPFANISLEEAAQQSDVLFLALPHGVAEKQVTKELLQKCKIIDLSADFRLKDSNLYTYWYKMNHTNTELLLESVYGLSEWYREEIAKAQLIANPGCYTTASILALAPLIKNNYIEMSSILIDAKSGVSGAGRDPKIATLFCEVADSMKPYGVGTHRHTPEIEEQLGLIGGVAPVISFTPHLIPLNRGMLATCYGTLTRGVSFEQCKEAFHNAYDHEPYITILQDGILPQTRWVKGTNTCFLSLSYDKRTGRIIVISAIDNLLKGASGQAVQNMNIMCGYPETMGLV